MQLLDILSFNIDGTGFGIENVSTIKINIMKLSIILTLVVLFLSTNIFSQNTNALRLDGVDEGVEIGSIDLGLTDELTVMAWVKWEVNPQESGVDDWANIISNNSTNTSDRGQFWLQHSSGNNNFEFALQTTSGRDWIFSSTTPQKDVWTHVAGVYRNDTMRIYINGIEESHAYHPGTINAFQSDFSIFIGQWSNSQNSYRNFQGSMEDVLIFSRGLYPPEINSIMDDPNTVNTSDPDLQGFWTMDDNNGSTTITDMSSNGNDGTISGGSGEIYSSDYPPLSDDGSLPVELTNFYIELENNNANIFWTTATETNSKEFVLLKSKDGINFKEVANIEAAGFSLSDKSYFFTDRNLSQVTYYYKLKQIDFNGQFEIFETKVVTIQSDIDYEIYPNPVNLGQSLNITFSGNNDSKVYVSVYNLSGELVLNKTVYENRIIIPTNKLQKGSYFISINNGGKSEIRKIIIN